MAVKIDLIADVKDVIKGTDKIGDALEDVADDLKDVGKAGEKVEDVVSDAFKNMERDAAQAGEKMEDSAADAFREMGRKAKAAGDTIGREVSDGTDRAGEGLEDMRSEAAGTAQETAASFGSIEDAAGALQEVVANAFAGFGPAGMAAGLVAAAGIGLAMSAMTEHAEEVTANKEKMLDLAQTIRDNGGVLTEADYISNMEEYGYAIQDAKEWWEIFQADAVSGFEQLRDLAKETGLSTRDIFRGGFGDAAEAKQTLDAVNKRLGELREKKDAVYQLTGSIISAPEAEEMGALERTKTLIEENIQAQKDAAMVDRIRKGGTESLTDAIEDNREILRKGGEAQKAAAENEADLAKYVQGTTEHYRAQADAIEEATDALKGSITTELDYLDARDDLTAKLKDSGNAWDINTAKGRENRRAVVDMASGIEDMAKAALDAGEPVADVTKKFDDQKKVLVDDVLPAFQGNREAAQAYIDTILKTPPIAKTKVELDKAEAERRLAELTSPKGIPMQILPDGTAVEKWFRDNNGRKIFIDVAPRGGGQAIALP